MASLNESGETCSRGGHLPGDKEGGKETAAAASVLIQDGQGPGGTAGTKTLQADEERNTSLENADVEDWVTVVQRKNKKLGSGVSK